MNDKKEYEVDRAVDWFALGIAWYFIVWPEYLILAWGPTLVALLGADSKTFHDTIIWGICTSALFIASLIFRKLGILIALLLGCAWGALAGVIGFYLTGQVWYWGTLAGIVVFVPAWAIHNAAFVRPSRAS